MGASAARPARVQLRLAVAEEPKPVRITRFGGGSRRSEALAAGLRRTIKPFIDVWSRVPLLPWPYGLVDYVGLALPPVPGTEIVDFPLPDCTAEKLTTPLTEDRVVVYLHGGAFLVGGRYLHRRMMSRIAELTRATVIAVNYRQLPRHAVSVSIADSLSAYRAVLESGVPAENIVIMGDSAGGYLTFQTALAAEAAGLPLPAGLVAMSPLIDFDGTVKVASPSSATCALFPPNCFDGLAQVVQRASRRAGEADALPDAPSRSALHGLPPSLIQASSAEMVYPDALAMARALTQAGVDLELQVWDGQVHVFQAASGLLREADQALEEIASFVDDVIPDSVWSVTAG